jgi:hypothetical protein
VVLVATGCVAVGAGVSVGGTGVDVSVGTGVSVGGTGVEVSVGTAVSVGVVEGGMGVSVQVGVGEGETGVSVDVRVNVVVGIAVSVAVAVAVAVSVAVGVAVGVGVGCESVKALDGEFGVPVAQLAAWSTLTVTGPESSITNPGGGVVSATVYVPCGSPSTQATPLSSVVTVLADGLASSSGPTTVKLAPANGVLSKLEALLISIAPGCGMGVSVNTTGAFAAALVQSASWLTTTDCVPGIPMS